jgi:hypothetical protein
MRTIVERNPGSLWLIGNEPDRQDLVDAERYAELYHDFYTFLKSKDPFSAVAIGGVVQPTPIRLQYLDQILDAYERRYKEQMPVDVWNVHNYVIGEGTTGWTCGIPPSTDRDLAIEYGFQDHDDLGYWTSHLIAMRAWMRDRGYRDRPLIISEFGILMPVIHGYDGPRVQAFMRKTFEWLITATDGETGYPEDGNRLVQAWAWFSLDDPGNAFDPLATWNHLFDPETGEITPLGLDYGTYAGSELGLLTGSVDLAPVSITPILVGTEASGLVTTTLTIEVRNRGEAPAEATVVRLERDGIAAGEVSLGSIPPGGADTVQIPWPHLEPGLYGVVVAVNPDRQIAECNHSNNRMSVTLEIGGSRILLPLGRSAGSDGFGASSAPVASSRKPETGQIR